MKKQTRKEKKAEEARVLAEMRAALDEAEREERGYTEAKAESETETEIEKGKESTPQTQAPVYHCRRCKTVMQNGVCPTCGFKMYVPMDEKKLGKIKIVLTAIGMAVFVFLFIYLQIKKG